MIQAELSTYRALVVEGARSVQRRWLRTNVRQKQCLHAVSRQGESHVPHSDARGVVLPHVVYTVLTTGTDRPGLRQVEKHRLGGVLTVQDHENNTVAGVAGPVLGGMRRVGCIVWVDTPSERADRFANVRVLVDLDKVFVAKDLNGLVCCVGKIGSNDQWRLHQSPRGEVRFCLFIRQIARRRALTGVAHLHDVHIVVAVEVRRPVLERNLIDDSRNRAPEWLDVSVDPPSLRDRLAPDPWLFPSPLAEREDERATSLACELSNRV